MELAGEVNIPLPQQRVWEGLNDPDVLKDCIPGCEEITAVGEHEYKVTLMASVGPVKARFNGKLQLTDVVEPTSYTINFEGSGGAAGFAKGGAAVSLAAEGEQATHLGYRAQAQIGGKIAQVGSRLIDGVARKIAAEFFERFSVRMGAPAAQPADTAVADQSASKPAAGSKPPAWVWWLVGAAVLVAAYFAWRGQ